MKSTLFLARHLLVGCMLLCSVSCLFPDMLRAQFSASTTAQLPGVLAASVAWGDYDSDGDLDIMLTGQDESATAISRVYKNAGGGVFTTAATLTGVSNGSVAWGDYDNDGDLDILLTGLDNSSTPVSAVYRNNGGDSFTSVAVLTGVYNSSVAWGDYDNDGDLDILLAGQTGLLAGIGRIYRNNGGDSFTHTVSLDDVYNGAAVAWGDYDSDGYADVVIAGQTGLLSGVARIYRNNTDGTFSTAVDLPNLSIGLSEASVAWGDYDNDGDLDLLVSGNNLLSLLNITTLYRNDGSNTFTASATLLGLASGSAAWGDYDNDGDIDIMQTGVSLGVGNSRVYRNDGSNTFAVSATLSGVLMSSCAWGDYDNDGDLDILLAGDTGLNPATILYNNTSTTANTAPSAPGGLQVAFASGTTATVSWSAATDTETPQSGISYNLRVGTTTNGVQVRSPMSNVETGLRHVPAIGNAFQTTATVFKNLTPGARYYWAVQAVDAGLRGSAFASGNFIAPTTTAIQLVVTSVVPASPQSGESCTITVGVRNSYGQTVAVTQATTVQLSFSHPYLVFGSGSSQATVQAGQSSTTLVFSINSSSSANITASLAVSSVLLLSTSQSITITPDDMHRVSRLVVKSVIPFPPVSGEPFVVTVESQNSLGQPAAVTQATSIGVSESNPYIVFTGGTQATLQVGQSSTTFTLIANSSSSASVAVSVTVSGGGLSSTSQSVTVNPDAAHIASQLVVKSVVPSPPVSGEPFVVTVESQNSFGQPAAVTQATSIGVSESNPYIVFTGGTQATLQVGQSSTTFTLIANSSSSASVAVSVTVSGGGMTSTSQSVTVNPDAAHIASQLVVKSVVPSPPVSGEPFVVTVESQNSLGQPAAVTQATTIGVSENNPYIVFTGGTQATLQVGQSSTTFTLIANSSSSASVAVSVTVSGGGMTSTSQSVIVNPDAAHIASQLVVKSVVPSPPVSGEPFVVTVESQNSFGQPAAVTQATSIGVSENNPYIVFTGGTQATLQVGQSSTTFTLIANSSSSASVAVSVTVSGGGMTSTSHSVAVYPDANHIASALVVASIAPLPPVSGEPFSVVVESRNSFGQLVPVNEAVVVSAAVDSPYLTFTGSREITLQAGRSTTTLTLIVNNSSSASVTASLVLSGSGMSSTNQSITMSPVLSFVVSQLAIVGISPAIPASGEPFSVLVEAHNSFGQAVPVTQATLIGAALNNFYLSFAGSTQATLQAGQSATTLVLTVNSTSTGSVSALLSVLGGGWMQAETTIAVSPLPRALQAAVLLEGPYITAEGEMSTALQQQGLLPAGQPYNYAPFNYAGSESATSFSAAAVDWVLIELRSTPEASSVVLRQAVVLRNDGALLDASGSVATIPGSVPDGNYYVVVYHRNHLPVMTAEAVALTRQGMAFDVSSNGNSAYRQFFDATKLLGDGSYAMFAGDTGQDGIIGAPDRVDARNHAGAIGYLASDISLDGIVNAMDRIMSMNNRFAVRQVP